MTHAACTLRRCPGEAAGLTVSADTIGGKPVTVATNNRLTEITIAIEAKTSPPFR